MDHVDLGLAIFVAVGSLVTGVVTVVWAIAQIKETTGRLGVHIQHLADEIKSIRDGHKDHEERIRRIENKHRGCEWYERDGNE
jgi:phage-related minor tail protein